MRRVERVVGSQCKVWAYDTEKPTESSYCAPQYDGRCMASNIPCVSFAMRPAVSCQRASSRCDPTSLGSGSGAKKVGSENTKAADSPVGKDKRTFEYG